MRHLTYYEVFCSNLRGYQKKVCQDCEWLDGLDSIACRHQVHAVPRA